MRRYVHTKLNINICCCYLVAKSYVTLCDPHVLLVLQAPLSMGFLRQEHWVGCHFFLQGIFLNQRSNPYHLHWQADSLPLSYQGCHINLDEGMLKSRDITLPTKVHLVKAMVFSVVMYGCESWTVKKAECQRIDAFELWCWRRLLRVPWTARRSNQSILKEVSPGISLED